MPKEEISHTLFEKHDKYNQMKDHMHVHIKALFVISLFMIGVGLGYFAFMMANLLGDKELPLNV